MTWPTGSIDGDGSGKLSLENLAARCIMVGLPGPELDPETTEKLESLRPAGVILFKRNLVDPEQTRGLLRRCAASIGHAPLLAVDQEGGRVSRLERWVGPTPSANRLTRAGARTVRAFGQATGRVLRSIGFNLDFAPVVDLSRPDAANGIGDRAFDTEPEQVGRLARQFLLGLQGEGVAGCLKHFPGLGDSAVDSHQLLPTVDHDRPTLDTRDLAPFRELLDLTPCVMGGHGHYPALDRDPMPATCSRAIVSGLLRHELGFRGVIVSDDMEMGAIRDRDVNGAAAVEAIGAGCDLLLYCSDLERGLTAVAAIARAAEEDSGVRALLRESSARINQLARAWPAALDGAVADARELETQFDPFRRLV